MQEASAIRKEEARRATEQKILEEIIQTEKERARLEQKTDRDTAIAEAEARAHEQKLSEDITRRMLIERMNGEKEKWLAAINTTFSHVEGSHALSISNSNVSFCPARMCRLIEKDKHFVHTSFDVTHQN